MCRSHQSSRPLWALCCVLLRTGMTPTTCPPETLARASPSCGQYLSDNIGAGPWRAPPPSTMPTSPPGRDDPRPARPTPGTTRGPPCRHAPHEHRGPRLKTCPCESSPSPSAREHPFATPRHLQEWGRVPLPPHPRHPAGGRARAPRGAPGPVPHRRVLVMPAPVVRGRGAGAPVPVCGARRVRSALNGRRAAW